MKELSAKIILLGEATVGKSSMMLRYFENRFEENIPNTIGTSFLTKIVEEGDSHLKMNVWDTCGQERFMALASIYYKDANVIILMLDCENERSLEQAEKYLDEIHSNANASVTIILVVNKIDLLPTYREGFDVDENVYKMCGFYDKIKKFKSKNGLDSLFWISAKEDIGVTDVFEYISGSIFNGKIRIVANEMKGSTKKLLAKSVIRNGAKKKKEGCC